MNDYTTIAELYDWYVTDTRDYAFWTRWAARATRPILELAAGTGRATIALLRGTGQQVVALDLAVPMLQRLAVRARQFPRHAWTTAGDMARLPLRSDLFGLVVVPFNSFGELTEPSQQVLALREMARVLAPDGCAVVTLHDPARRRQTLNGEIVRMGSFPAGDGRRLELLVSGRVVAGNLAESEQAYRLLDTGDRLLDERHLTLRFVLLDAGSLASIAQSVGLEATVVFGDYDESPYVPGTSPFIIAVLRRSGPRTSRKTAAMAAIPDANATASPPSSPPTIPSRASHVGVPSSRA